MAHTTVWERIFALPEELRREIFGRCSLGKLTVLAHVNQEARQLVKSTIQQLCLHVPGELHDLDQTSLRILRHICADTTKNVLVLLPEARCLSEKYDPKPFTAADLQWKTLTSAMAKMSKLSSLRLGDPSCLHGSLPQSMKIVEMLTVMLLSTELRVNHLQIWATAEMLEDIIWNVTYVLSSAASCGKYPVYLDFARHIFGKHPCLDTLDIRGGEDGTTSRLTRGKCHSCNCKLHTTYVEKVPCPGGLFEWLAEQRRPLTSEDLEEEAETLIFLGNH